MNDQLIRIIEIIIGVSLIATTLIAGRASNPEEISPTILLLSLVAIPIIFSGIYAWHPAKYAAKLCNKILEPLKRRIFFKHTPVHHS